MMNDETRMKAMKSTLGALAMALMSIGLPSEVRADQACETSDCTVNAQPGQCGTATVGGTTSCYCYQVGGSMAEKEPACNSIPPL